MLDIVPSYNPVQYHRKQMMQTYGESGKPNFGANFGPFNFFSWVLPLLVVTHSFKLSSYPIWKKTNKNQTWESDKKPNFGHDLGSLGPNSGHQFFFKTSC